MGKYAQLSLVYVLRGLRVAVARAWQPTAAPYSGGRAHAPAPQNPLHAFAATSVKKSPARLKILKAQWAHYIIICFVSKIPKDHYPCF